MTTRFTLGRDMAREHLGISESEFSELIRSGKLAPVPDSTAERFTIRSLDAVRPLVKGTER